MEDLAIEVTSSGFEGIYFGRVKEKRHYREYETLVVVKEGTSLRDVTHEFNVLRELVDAKSPYFVE